MKLYESEQLEAKYRFSIPVWLVRGLGAFISARALSYAYCLIPWLKPLVTGAMIFWLLFAVLTALSAYGNVQQKRAAIGAGEARMLLVLATVAIVFFVGWQLEALRGMSSCVN